MRKGKKRNLNETTALTKPTLDEELKTFKAIVRHITKYEAEPTAARWFTADNRPCLRRLGNVGINGREPSIAVYCKMTNEEKERVTDAILTQKIANNRSLNCSPVNIGKGKRKTKKAGSSYA